MKKEVTCGNIRRLQTSVYVNQNDSEHCLSYNRQDGSRVEMALIHVPGQELTFATAIYPPSSNDSDDIPVPKEIVKLSIDELRVHFAWVEHLFAEGIIK